jgi:hypothetical protein
MRKTQQNRRRVPLVKGEVQIATPKEESDKRHAGESGTVEHIIRLVFGAGLITVVRYTWSSGGQKV